MRVKKLKEKDISLEKKRISKYVFTVLVITTLLLNIYSPTLGQTKQDTLWEKEPLIISSKTPDNLWYLKGYRNGPNNKAWKTTADTIRAKYLEKESEILTKNLGKIFVNPYNNTVFILTKSMDKDTVNSISRN